MEVAELFVTRVGSLGIMLKPFECMEFMYFWVNRLLFKIFVINSPQITVGIFCELMFPITLSKISVSSILFGLGLLYIIINRNK